jgi:hypothetical protein
LIYRALVWLSPPQLALPLRKSGPKDIRQFAMATGRLGGVAKATHTPLAELFSLMGGGGRGAMMFSSML